jgi:ABC-type sugar transport system ATPase subunit
MSYLSVKNIVKTYKNEAVVQQLSLELEKGKTLSVLGKSGCGKSTLLKIVAGLLDFDSGEIELDGNSINELEPAERGIVYLYQEPLLFPHLNVFENIAFGLRLRSLDKQEIEQRTIQMIGKLGLVDHSDKMPEQLSGGQRQRVAFGRAIIINPAVLLLDEPFGNLDTEIRAQMQQFFMQLSEQFSITTLFVTHDLKEALLVGDSMGLMEHGQLTCYQSKEAFVADVRTGATNEISFWEQFNENTD